MLRVVRLTPELEDPGSNPMSRAAWRSCREAQGHVPEGTLHATLASGNRPAT